MVLDSLTYFSRSRLDPAARPLLHQVSEIIAKARPNNARYGLTGYLLFDNGWFAQTIEGVPATVDARFAVISRDSRHSDVKVIDRRRIGARHFGKWSMGASFASLSRTEVFLANGARLPFEPAQMPPQTLVSVIADLADADRVAIAAAIPAYHHAR